MSTPSRTSNVQPSGSAIHAESSPSGSGIQSGATPSTYPTGMDHGESTHISALSSSSFLQSPSSRVQPFSQITQRTRTSQPPAADPAPTPARRRRTPTLYMLLSTGALIMVMAGILVAYFLIGPGATVERRAQNAVKSFMTAYAKGDADKVRSYLVDNNQQDRSLIVNAVLKASATRASISNIIVPSVAPGEPLHFAVQYTIGDQPALLVITARPNGLITKLEPALTPVNLKAFHGLPVTIDGVRPATDMPLLPPGTYTVGIDTEYHTVTPDRLTFTSAVAETAGLKPNLSEAGVAAFRATLRKTVADCLAAKTLVSACGLTISPSNEQGTATAQEGSVERTMNQEAQNTLNNVSFAPSPDNPAIVSTSGPLGVVQYDFGCVIDGQQKRCHMSNGSGPQLRKASIIMTKSPLVVIWS